MAAITDFLAMGGYGVYVWPAYGLTLLILAGMLGVSLARLRACRREIERYEAMRPHGRRRRHRQETP